MFHVKRPHARLGWPPSRWYRTPCGIGFFGAARAWLRPGLRSTLTHALEPLPRAPHSFHPPMEPTFHVKQPAGLHFRARKAGLLVALAGRSESTTP
jgi:hypothetical protein